MLSRDRQLRTQLHLLVDLCLFLYAFWFAHTVRDRLQVLFPNTIDPIASFDQYAWLYMAILPMVPLFCILSGFYTRPMLLSRRSVLWRLGKASSFTTGGLILVMFFFRTIPDLARGVIVLFGMLGFFLVWLKEELFRYGFSSKFGQLQLTRRFVLMGNPKDTKVLAEKLRSKKFEGVDILAQMDWEATCIPRLVELLHEHSVNGVILLPEYRHMEKIEETIQVCELEGVEAWLLADGFKTQISRISLDDFYGRPVMVFRSTPEMSWQGLAKQILDFSLALVLLILSSLLLVVVALLIRLSSKGPVLFRQQRCGLNGQPFTMLKFRSMASDAEQRQQELAALNEMSGPVFKITNDPRITPIGRWLRRYSIDEWPQLINVLRGEMSMVGPRPLPVEEVKRFDNFSHRRRLSVRPGITCLWQVSGRSNVTDFKDWVRLDLEYIDNWSLWLDLKILWKTIPIVLLGTGAK